jgi:DNA-binding Xre family transcriptional regulator
MAQTEALIETLKRVLRVHGKTYADVARALDLSEASVKRLFSERSLSLQRLDRICALVELEISDVVQRMNEGVRRLTQLTETQEREIAADNTLLLVAVCVVNRWTLEDIVRHYVLTEHECIRYLARLDRLKVIELLPRNQIKLLIAPNFRWRTAGPIQRLFHARVEKEFFASRFREDTERLIVLNGMLTRQSNAAFQRKLERLAHEFNELNDDDAGVPVEQRRGTTAVLAIRQWQYSQFAELRRPTPA